MWQIRDFGFGVVSGQFAINLKFRTLLAGGNAMARVDCSQYIGWPPIFALRG